MSGSNYREVFHNYSFQSIALPIGVHGTSRNTLAIFNFNFINIFVIQNIDDNWRYNVV